MAQAEWSDRALELGKVTIENGLLVRRDQVGAKWVKATCVHCKKKWWRDASTDPYQVCGPCVGKRRLGVPARVLMGSSLVDSDGTDLSEH